MLRSVVRQMLHGSFGTQNSAVIFVHFQICPEERSMSGQVTLKRVKFSNLKFSSQNATILFILSQNSKNHFRDGRHYPVGVITLQKVNILNVQKDIDACRILTSFYSRIGRDCPQTQLGFSETGASCQGCPAVLGPQGPLVSKGTPFVFWSRVPACSRGPNGMVGPGWGP